MVHQYPGNAPYYSTPSLTPSVLIHTTPNFPLPGSFTSSSSSSTSSSTSSSSTLNPHAPPSSLFTSNPTTTLLSSSVSYPNLYPPPSTTSLPLSSFQPRSSSPSSSSSSSLLPSIPPLYVNPPSSSSSSIPLISHSSVSSFPNTTATMATLPISLPTRHSTTPPTHPSSSSSSLSTDTSPLPPQVQALFQFIPDDLSTKTLSCALHALKVTQSNFEKAVEYLEDWASIQRDSSDTSLPPLKLFQLPSSPYLLQGIENGGNTCYIDSLIFALFAQLDCLDPFLLRPPSRLSFPPPSYGSLDPIKHQELRQRYLYHIKPVQLQLALIVIRLRKGYCITSLEMQHLETSIHYLWTSIGKLNSHVGNQEDVTELFFLLADALDIPYLPIMETQKKISKPNDVRLNSTLWTPLQNVHPSSSNLLLQDQVTQPHLERCLQLCIPHSSSSNPSTPISVADLVYHYFKDASVIHDPFLSSSSSSSSVSSSHESQEPCVCRHLQWVPPTTPISLLDSSSSSSSSSSMTLVPMLLKKYTMKAPGQPMKLNCPLHVPFHIDITPFTAFPNPLPFSSSSSLSSTSSMTTTPLNPSTPPSFFFYAQLRLRSVICHQGSLHSGHFIAFTMDKDQPNQWFRFDGLHSNQRVRAGPFAQFQHEFNQHAYLLFYEFQWGYHENKFSSLPPPPPPFPSPSYTSVVPTSSSSFSSSSSLSNSYSISNHGTLFHPLPPPPPPPPPYHASSTNYAKDSIELNSNTKGGYKLTTSFSKFEDTEHASLGLKKGGSSDSTPNQCSLT